MPARLGLATLYLLLAYWIVTLLGLLLTVAVWLILQPATPEELGVSAAEAPAYTMTLPLHPLLNVLVWPLFALRYLRGLPSSVPLRREGLRLGAFWAVVTIIVDPVGWVLIPHPWAMTLKEFYVDYQPWITVIYLVIFLSPVVIARRLTPRTAAATG
jgi:hypothetical protein